MNQLLLTGLICATSIASPAETSANGGDSLSRNGRVPEASQSEAPRAYRLENGLEVVLAPDPRHRAAALNIWYHVGADHEAEDQRGIAHLAEHLMFEGTAHVATGEHVRRLRKIGAEVLNAHTGRHRTRYLTTLPPEGLETLLWLEADRMGYLLQGLSRRAFERERRVVLRELRERVDLAPYGLAEARLWEMLFPAGHPYNTRIEGIAEQLEALSFNDVRRFIDRWYAPSNATLVIVGRFDEDHVRALIDRYFGGLPAKRLPRAPVVEEAPPARRSVVSHDEQAASKPAVVMGWQGPVPGSKESVLAALTAELLGAGGRGGLLYERLVRELGLASRVSVISREESAQSVFRIRAVARPGVEPETLLEAIDDYLAELGAGELLEADVERARRRLSTRRASKLDGALGLIELAERIHQGRRGLLPESCVSPDALDKDAVAAFIRETLSRSQGAVLLARSGPGSRRARSTGQRSGGEG